MAVLHLFDKRGRYNLVDNDFLQASCKDFMKAVKEPQIHPLNRVVFNKENILPLSISIDYFVVQA